MKDNPDASPRSKDRIPALEEEVRSLKSKLKADYPDATPEQLEVAIGNALGATDQSLDEARVEEIARKHLGPRS